MQVSLATHPPVTDTAAPPRLALTLRSLESLGIRQWGLPNGCYPGRAWRTHYGPDDARTWSVTCMVPCGDDRLLVQTLDVELVDRLDQEEVPESWRLALADFVREHVRSAELFHLRHGALSRLEWLGAIAAQVPTLLVYEAADQVEDLTDAEVMDIGWEVRHLLELAGLHEQRAGSVREAWALIEARYPEAADVVVGQPRGPFQPLTLEGVAVAALQPRTVFGRAGRCA